MPCISKAERHRRAGTLDQFRARQEASRAGAAAAEKRRAQEPREPTLEERITALEERVEWLATTLYEQK